MRRVKSFLILVAHAVATMAPALAGGAGDRSHPDGAHWNVPEAAAKRPNPVPATAESIARGRKLFEANCVRCHGAQAEGDGPAGKGLNPAPTDLRAMAGAHADGDFAWKIANGRGPMPAWKDTLGEPQIWDLVIYIQSLRDSHHDGHHHAH